MYCSSPLDESSRSTTKEDFLIHFTVAAQLFFIFLRSMICHHVAQISFSDILISLSTTLTTGLKVTFRLGFFSTFPACLDSILVLNGSELHGEPDRIVTSVLDATKSAGDSTTLNRDGEVRPCTFLRFRTTRLRFKAFGMTKLILVDHWNRCWCLEKWKDQLLSLASQFALDIRTLWGGHELRELVVESRAFNHQVVRRSSINHGLFWKVMVTDEVYEFLLV